MCLCSCGNESIVSRSNLVTGHTKSCGCIGKKRINRRKSIVGERFGRLVVLEMLYGYKNKQTYCSCICDCGNTKIIYAGNLKAGRSKSCGCGEIEARYQSDHSKDVSGLVFNDLTVVERTSEKNSFGSVLWVCRCVCGNLIRVTSTDLKRGRVVSCGCNYEHPLKENLTGQTFGNLLVVEENLHRVSNRVEWICKCVCGNFHTVIASDLKTGSTKSCGCMSGSNAVAFIRNTLQENNIAFMSEYKFKDCKNIRPLPFDFYLPDHNVLIEYDGMQHFEPVEFYGGEEKFKQQQINDGIKNSYCEKNNIQLIRLPYTLSFDEIENIILNIQPRND